MKNYKGIILVLLLTMVSTDILAQSGIYVCGYFRRNRSNTVTKIKNSGYTNAILFNVDIQEDGTLTTDYNWSTQTPAEAGGIICKDGQYVFGQYQPNYANDVKSLLVAPVDQFVNNITGLLDAVIVTTVPVSYIFFESTMVGAGEYEII